MQRIEINSTSEKIKKIILFHSLEIVNVDDHIIILVQRWSPEGELGSSSPFIRRWIYAFVKNLFQNGKNWNRSQFDIQIISSLEVHTSICLAFWAQFFLSPILSNWVLSFFSRKNLPRQHLHIRITRSRYLSHESVRSTWGSAMRQRRKGTVGARSTR